MRRLLEKLFTGSIDNVVDEGADVGKTAIKRGQYVKLGKLSIVGLIVLILGIALIVSIGIYQENPEPFNEIISLLKMIFGEVS